MNDKILDAKDEDYRLFKTDKTDETVCVSNVEFMEAIFGEEYSDIRPMTISFIGNPSEVSPSAWQGVPWSRETVTLPDRNNYFSLSSFRPNDAGDYKRRKKQFYALHAVVLDDVGTKVEAEKIKLRPSWVLETSKDNFQIGYILSQPLQEAVRADSLVNAVIEAGLCDRGANGPTTRIVRLPEGVNGKRNPIFTCCMKKWEPDERYSIDQLIQGLDLDINLSNHKKNHKISVEQNDTDLVYVPCSSENVVISALKEKGLYKCQLGNGLHDITCPWVKEHTDSVDGGTGYYEPNDNYPTGGFNCFHGHCQERHINELLEKLGIDKVSARMKPTIRYVQGELHRIVDAAERELAVSGKYYQRGGSIVVISTDPCTKEIHIKGLSKPALASALSSVCMWEKYSNASGKMMRIDPPERHCNALFDLGQYKHLPLLNGIAYQPYLRGDGSLVKENGYDKIMGTYGTFKAEEFCIGDAPTKEDAERALHTLHSLLEEFPFQNDYDLSAALSAFLTASVRTSLPLAPMYHVKAPQMGSGKTFLCRVIALFAGCRAGMPSIFPSDNEECQKFLLAEFMRSPSVIEFDNLTTDILPYKSLCAALTSEYMAGRILGVSKIATVNTRSLILSSGNNVGPVKDMTRRCITITLNPNCEIPAAREFKKPDLLSDLINERSKYVAAALTIIRAWITAGRPKKACKSIANYNEWSDFCRQPLMWLGLPDPTQSMFESMSDDPERETLRRLLDAWYECFGHSPKMLREVLGANGLPPSAPIQELREILHDIAGERDFSINRRRLGWWMKNHAGQIVAGRRLVKEKGNRSAEAWKVEEVS